MAKYKTLSEFKRDHKTFFKNGNLDQAPEAYRVWRGHLIVMTIYPQGLQARAWVENDAGALTPASELKKTILDTIEYPRPSSLINYMRNLIDARIDKESE